MTQPESVAMTTSHKPTMRLRFIERVLQNGARPVRILQQQFIPHNWDTHDEEWRDVPLELQP